MGYFSISSLLSSSPGLLDGAKVSVFCLIFIVFQMAFSKTYLAFSFQNLFVKRNIKSIILLLLGLASIFLCISAILASSISYKEGYYMVASTEVIPRPISLYSPENLDFLSISVLFDQLSLYFYTSALFLALSLWRPTSFFLLQENTSRAKSIMTAMEFSIFKWYSISRLIVLVTARLCIEFLVSSELVAFVDNIFSVFQGLELMTVSIWYFLVYKRLRAILDSDKAEESNHTINAIDGSTTLLLNWIYHPLLYYYLENLVLLLTCLSFQILIFLVRMTFQFAQIQLEVQIITDIITLFQNASFASSFVILISIIVVPHSYRMVMGIDDEFYFFEDWNWSWKKQMESLNMENNSSIEDRYSGNNRLISKYMNNPKSNGRWSEYTVDQNGVEANQDFEFFLNAPKAAPNFSFRFSSMRRRSSAQPLVTSQYRNSQASSEWAQSIRDDEQLESQASSVWAQSNRDTLATSAMFNLRF